MAKELAFVLINPYTTAKSRTGGVIGRFLSRTGLELVAARIFAPGMALVEEYAELVKNNPSNDPAMQKLFSEYILTSYSPNPLNGRPRRVFMLLFEGEDAIRKIKDTAGSVKMGSGETVRDTFGDYVLDENNNVRYFEPAVLIGSSVEETSATLKLWARHAKSDGGIVAHATDVEQTSDWQKTLVLIKPDNFLFPSARPGSIVDVLSKSGLRIIATRVVRMSIAQAEEFYAPIRNNLTEKMKKQVSERAAKVLQTEFSMPISEDIFSILEEKIGPLLGEEQFKLLINFMTGRNIAESTEEEKHMQGLQRSLALVYGGSNAVNIIRGLLGTTDPTKADFGSVRREFGRNIMINAAHASDSVENAEREMRIIGFDEDAVSSWVEKYYGR